MLKAYTSNWQLSKPFTIISKNPENGELACPGVFKLPCGDLLLGYADEGDFVFASGAYLRSKDNGKTWQKTQMPLNHVAGIISLDHKRVIAYETYMFSVRGSNREYIGRMSRSFDGGQTFGQVEYFRYYRPGMRNLTVRDFCQGASLPENVKRYRDVFEKCGWEEIDWLDVEMCYHYPAPTSYLRLDDGSFLNLFYTGSRGDGSTAGFRYSYHIFASTSKDGVHWEHLSRVTPLDESNLPNVPYWRHYAEPTVARTAEGDILCILRDCGNGWPLKQTRSSDNGKSWSPLESVDQKVRSILPNMQRLDDGALMMTYGRPGMFVMFDPTGTGRHWEIDDRLDLWDGEELTLKTQAEVKTARGDLNSNSYRQSAVGDVPIEELSWVRKDLLNGKYCGWENVQYAQVEPNKFLIVYDVQNCIETPGAKPVKAVRGVWLTKVKN